MKTTDEKIKEIESVLNTLTEHYWEVDDNSNRGSLTIAYRKLEDVKSYLEDVKSCEGLAK